VSCGSVGGQCGFHRELPFYRNIFLAHNFLSRFSRYQEGVSSPFPIRSAR
jgi:hypothetical protein